LPAQEIISRNPQGEESEIRALEVRIESGVNAGVREHELQVRVYHAARSAAKDAPGAGARHKSEELN